MEQIVKYFLMVLKSKKLKQKCFSINNMKKTELYRYVYDFSVDYDATVVDDVLDIYIFNEKEWYIIEGIVYIKCLDLLGNFLLRQWRLLVVPHYS